MFRKPPAPYPPVRKPVPPSSSCSPPASSKPESPPPSAKKQKTTHPTSTFTTPSRPRPPRQTQLTTFLSTSPASKKSAPSTSKSSGKNKPKNASILNFFKPVAKQDRKGGDLFLGDEGFGLDISDAEGEEENEDEDVEMALWGKPHGEEEDEPETATPGKEVALGIRQRKPVVERGNEERDEEVEATPAHKSPLPETLESMEPVKPPPKTRPDAPKFNPSALHLNLSSSILFGKASPSTKAAPSMTASTVKDNSEDAAVAGAMNATEDTKDVDIPISSVSSEGGVDSKPEIAKETPKGNIMSQVLLRAKRPWDEFEEEENEGEFIDDDEDFAQIQRFNKRLMELEEDDYIQVVIKPPDVQAQVQFSPEPTAPKCPICAVPLEGLSEEDANTHVNRCLDGDLPPPKSKYITQLPASRTPNPHGAPQHQVSAFTKLLSSNTEAQAWASAAKAEAESKGKRAADRTCPFYKILFNGPITVDAFRYGKIPGCTAYFLSHFHSDHYIGLSSKWDSGPIYCSRVTANLVRARLKVDPKWVFELPWEEWVDIPDTNGVRVRGLDANHCPGSMLFLFEKAMGAKTTRVLHCGDFRAEEKHLNHPLLRPGENRKQKLDAVYLDTTYLDPKYSFPSQQRVINACAETCIHLNNNQLPKSEPGSITSFVTTNAPKSQPKGRLLVVVGTYSIGKERIATGIAKALNTQIYAPPQKISTLRLLEDRALTRLLTSSPWAAQVHLTPLGSIDTPTLSAYLAQHPTFSRIIAFKPSGWSYKPPVSRTIGSPKIEDVLYSPTWRSEYSARDMVPIKGGNDVVKCYAVPYSEHSSFRELCLFACALEVGRVVPTVNMGSAKSRERIRAWIERWEGVRKRGGIVVGEEEGVRW